jgi:hypothetical protein
MAITAQRSIIGITAIGSYTGAKGGPYVKTSWGLTQPAGATVRHNTNVVEQNSGQSIVVVHSFIDSGSAELEFGLINGVLETLRRMMGLATGALVGDLAGGTPTMETLTVNASGLGAVEQSLYITTPGPAGPRNYYFPHSAVRGLPELVQARSGYLEPRARFAIYPDPATLDLYWIEDSP